MERYSEKTIQLVNYGRQDCSDMHSWGPGMRPCHIIHYVLRGAGYLEYHKKRYRIEAEESFLIAPYEEVYYYPDETDPWEYVWVDFMGDQAESYLKDLGLHSGCRMLPTIKQEELLPLFELLQGLEPIHRDKGLACGLLLAILGKYGDRQLEQREEVPERRDTRLATAVMLIHTNYYRSYFHVETLCERLQLGRVTLYRLFQNNLQTSPSQYLLQYRLAQAEKMLQMGMSVKNTALSCGFADPFYFSKMFKKYRGVSPSNFSQ